MIKICAAGELLIDFTPCGTGPGGQALYARNPGGAPANMLAMAAKLGAAVYLCSKVGNDNFGDFLIKSVIDAGINESHIRRTENERTTLAIVDLDESNDRSFTFYRKPGADIMLEDSDIVEILQKNNSIQDAVLQLVNAALEHGGRDNITVILCRIR